MLIIDNISCLFSGLNEDSKQDWEPINAWLIRLRHRGLTTVLVHHAGKSGQQRGTSGREDSLDTVIQLSLPAGYDPREGCHFELHFTKCRSVQGDAVASLDVHLQANNGASQWCVKPVEVSKLDRASRLVERVSLAPVTLRKNWESPKDTPRSFSKSSNTRVPYEALASRFPEGFLRGFLSAYKVSYFRCRKSYTEFRKLFEKSRSRSDVPRFPVLETFSRQET